jgi:DNA-binding SARP family transcriptional activator
LDLRPYRRISAVGDREGLRQFVDSLVSGQQEKSQVISVAGAVDGLFETSELTHIAKADDLVGALSIRREGVESLLLLMAPNRTEKNNRGDEDVARTALISLEGLLISPTITVRLLFLGPYHDVEAIISLDPVGGRSLFVSSVFVEELRTAAVEDQQVLFDRAGTIRVQNEVSIAILGPISTSDTVYPLERHPLLTELVVYLALHPKGTTSRNWVTALWPERRVAAQTVANRLSETRHILGFASDGLPRLRRDGERYTLVECRTDWQIFQELAQSDAPEDWRTALSLVRGRPFDDLAQGQWVVFEGYLAEIERTVADLAIDLGDFALNNDDAKLGAWAAQQALRACPFDERLHRLLMRTADALGNRAGVEETLRQLALILEIDGNPLHGVHPETKELYYKLTNTN